MKRLSTLLAMVALALCFSVGQAVAAESPGSADQAAGQSADSGQKADGDGSAYQSGAANRAYDIRVLSPGDSGDVTQSNNVTAVGIAANDNDTKQSLDQSQTGGGSGSDYTQIAGQEATSEQDADADATAKQIAPTNEAFSIRVLSPGGNGDVNQSNSALAGALAKNDNDTKQGTRPVAVRRRVGLRLHADRWPGGCERPGRRRRCEGRPTPSEQHGDFDPGAQPGQRWRRHAVEQLDRSRGRAERQRHEADDRPVARNRRPGARKGAGARLEGDGQQEQGLGLHADRRPEGRQRAEGRR